METQQTREMESHLTNRFQTNFSVWLGMGNLFRVSRTSGAFADRVLTASTLPQLEKKVAKEMMGAQFNIFPGEE